MSREWPTEGGAQEIDVGTWDLPGSTSSLYIGCWVWFDAQGTTDIRFFSKSSSTASVAHRFMLGTLFSSGGLKTLRSRLRMGATTQTFTATDALAGLTSQWIHCAVRYDGANVDLFVNGTEVSDAAYAFTTTVSGGSSDSVFIGNQPGTSGNAHAIDGRIADLICTTYAPTNGEISTFAADTRHTSLLDEAGTQGYWLLDGGSPEPDDSGNGRDGTVDAGITVAADPPFSVGGGRLLLLNPPGMSGGLSP